MNIIGNNLIITFNGHPIAGAKACTIRIQASTIQTLNYLMSNWEQYIKDKMRWSVSTRHLLPAKLYDGSIIVQGSCHNGVTNNQSFVQDGNGFKINILQRGLSLVKLSLTKPYQQIGQIVTYDTYADESLCNTMASDIANLSDDCVYCIVSQDAISINSALADAIKSNLNMPNETIPIVSAQRYAFAAIGFIRSGLQGRCIYSDGVPDIIHSEMYFSNNIPLSYTPMRNMKSLIGQLVKIRCAVDGYPNDVMEGYAICTDIDITGNVGGIVTGNFNFIGSGPLQ